MTSRPGAGSSASASPTRSGEPSAGTPRIALPPLRPIRYSPVPSIPQDRIAALGENDVRPRAGDRVGARAPAVHRIGGEARPHPFARQRLADLQVVQPGRVAVVEALGVLEAPD